MKNYIILVITIFAIVISIFVLKKICIVLSNRYVSKNKERLFNDNKTLSQICKNLEVLLLEQRTTYFEFIGELGLNQTYNCSSSIVSNASNNTIKYLIKYSNIENNIHCLEQLDFCANYIKSLDEFRDNINKLYLQVESQLPVFVKLFATKNKVPYLILQFKF